MGNSTSTQKKNNDYNKMIIFSTPKFLNTNVNTNVDTDTDNTLHMANYNFQPFTELKLSANFTDSDYVLPVRENKIIHEQKHYGGHQSDTISNINITKDSDLTELAKIRKFIEEDIQLGGKTDNIMTGTRPLTGGKYSDTSSQSVSISEHNNNTYETSDTQVYKGYRIR